MKTPIQKRSAAAKKARENRKRMDAARAARKDPSHVEHPEAPHAQA